MVDATDFVGLFVLLAVAVILLDHDQIMGWFYLHWLWLWLLLLLGLVSGRIHHFLFIFSLWLFGLLIFWQVWLVLGLAFLYLNALVFA